jgi:hypothetical protein
MAAMTHYYSRMKGSIEHIDPKEMSQLTEDWMITAAAGAGVGLVSATLGGLDRKIMGYNVPVDGLISIALGVGGLMVRDHRYSSMMKVASIAAGGSAAVRTFEKFFKSNIHLGIKGEFEDLGHRGIGYRGYPGLPGYQPGPGVAYGMSAQDRLVEAARYL